MNYYEELGIRSDADEEEIRKAHRRLVKLMHPDQHRDQGMKQLAETQMRRLNSIVSTLLDPEERREYDEQLRGNEALSQAPQQSTWRSVPWWIASTLGAIVLTVGAVWFFADRMGAKFRDTATSAPQVENLGTPDTKTPSGKSDVTTVPVPMPAAPKPFPEEKPTVVIPPAANLPDKTVASVPVPPVEKPKPQEPAKKADPFPPAPVAPKTTAVAKVIPPPKPKPVVVPPKRVKQEDAAAKNLDRAARVTSSPPVVKAPPVVKPPVAVATAKSNPAPTPSAPADSHKLPGYIPVVTAQPPPDKPAEVASLRPPPSTAGVAPATAIDIPKSVEIPKPPPSVVDGHGSRDPLEGEWVYAPTEPEKRKPGFYTPEFIQLKLKKDTSGMRGEYSARYNVADNRPVSPNVNFVLKAVDNKALKYVWTAADGSHGWFVIKNLEPDTMRLEWRTTSRAGAPALSSGMATLVRKN